MVGSAPLTYGQLSTWRSIETFAPERLMEVNVPGTWDLRGTTTEAALTALRRLTRRHESLRTVYEVVDGRPVQRVLDAWEPQIEVGEGDTTDPQASTSRLLQRPFPVTGDTGWRGAVTTLDGRAQFLSLSFSHMVVDLWAAQELEAQFRSLLAAPDRDPGPALTARELARIQHDESWTLRRRGAERYWRRLLAGGPVRNLSALPPRSNESRVQATLRSHALHAFAVEAARSHGVSPQSLLMAATALALAQVLERDRVMLSLMSANRFDPVWRPLISTMNQLVPFVCAVDPDLPLVTYLKRTHLGALLSYRHGVYDVDLAAGWAAEAASESGRQFEHDCWFNYLVEDVTGARSLVDTEQESELHWSPPPRNAGHPFYARVTQRCGGMEVTLRVDPDIFPADAIVTMLHVIARTIHQAVTAPEEPVHTLGEARGPLSASLFPAEPPMPDSI